MNNKKIKKIPTTIIGRPSPFINLLHHLGQPSPFINSHHTLFHYADYRIAFLVKKSTGDFVLK